MFDHPLMTEALKQCTDWERHVARNMSAICGPEWWYTYAHPQTIRDYVTAKHDAGRLSAMRTMLRDAVQAASNAAQALVPR